MSMQTWLGHKLISTAISVQMSSSLNRRAFLISQVPYMLMADAALTLLTWFPGAIFGPLQLGMGIQFPS